MNTNSTAFVFNVYIWRTSTIFYDFFCKWIKWTDVFQAIDPNLVFEELTSKEKTKLINEYPAIVVFILSKKKKKGKLW